MNIKEEIIRIVADMENQIGTDIMGDLFQKESTNSSDEKIGTNQFREIASMCTKAEIYEEIELLVKYTIAKVIPEKKKKNGEIQEAVYKSWKKICSNKKWFGENVLDAMAKVKALDENNTLKNMELFFGYLYWQARIWADKYGNDSNRNRNYNNQMPNNHNRQANRN